MGDQPSAIQLTQVQMRLIWYSCYRKAKAVVMPANSPQAPATAGHREDVLKKPLVSAVGYKCFCPASIPLAGFEASLIGRFSGVPRRYLPLWTRLKMQTGEACLSTIGRPVPDGSSTDVFICGAGAARLTLTIDLARRGVAFRLIDMAEGPFQGSRGKGLRSTPKSARASPHFTQRCSPPTCRHGAARGSPVCSTYRHVVSFAPDRARSR
jgi:hypothetical protein